MAGYLNRFIRLQFADLGGVDDLGNAHVWVIIRNPRLMPIQDLLGGTTVPIGEDGMPVDGKAAQDQVLAMMGRLIVAGHVWDPTWVPEFDAGGEPVNPDEEPPLLTMPPSAQEAGKMPVEILNAVGDEVKKASPR